MRGVIRDIRNGKFAKEWSAEQARGYVSFKKLQKRALQHPINKTELKVRAVSTSPKNFSTK